MEKNKQNRLVSWCRLASHFAPTQRLLRVVYQWFTLLFLLALGSQCTQQAVEKKADGPCLIKQIDETSVQSGSGIEPMTNTRTTTYEYDTTGRPTHVLEHYLQRTPKQGLITDYATEDTYSYNTAGYLTSLVNKVTYKTINDAGTWGTRTTYVYTNGRLCEQTARSSSSVDGIEQQTLSSYTYDAGGLLTQRKEQITYPVVPDSLRGKPRYLDGAVTTWTYQNGQAVGYVQKVNGIESRPYTFQNGLIQTESQGTDRRVNTYDAQGRRLKTEHWQNGILTSTEERTYAAARPATDTWPAFKGLPAAVLLNTSVPGVLSGLSFRHLLSNGAYFTTSMTAQVKTTGASFVRAAEEVDTHTNYDSQGSSYQIRTSRTYTYNGTCD